MCKPASFVVTKENGDYKVYFSENVDSHTDIIEEFGFKDVPNVRGEPRLIPCEIVPPNGDYRLPIEKWVFKSDISPEWADIGKIEQACRQKLPEWYKYHVINKGEHKLTGNISRVILGGKVIIDNQSFGYCQFFDNSQRIKK